MLLLYVRYVDKVTTPWTCASPQLFLDFNPLHLCLSAVSFAHLRPAHFRLGHLRLSQSHIERLSLRIHDH